MGRPMGFAVLCLTVLGCGPGGSGGTGDPRAEVEADKFGSGQRLVDILEQRYEAITSSSDTWLDPVNEESVSCAKIPVDFETQVSGVAVLAQDDFDETGSGAIGNYYVQDTDPESTSNAGMTVFQPGFSPPDLRVVPGDVVDIFGLVTEFDGPSVGKFGFCRTLPEMSGSVTFRFEGYFPQPVEIGIEELGTYVAARQYIGMLVTVKNVILSEPPFASNGRYSIRFDPGAMIPNEDIPNINNELMDLSAALPPETMPGTVLASVTGIVTYFYGVHLAPRSAADIVQ